MCVGGKRICELEKTCGSEFFRGEKGILDLPTYYLDIDKLESTWFEKSKIVKNSRLGKFLVS